MEGQNNMEETLWSTMSVRILRNKSLNLLSALLNPPKIIHTDEGLPRNWKGLAELCSLESYLISNLEFNSDPTRELLRIWHGKNEKNATITNLISFLEKIDRFDVIDDVKTSFEDDVEFHKQQPKNQATILYNNESEKLVLTVDDVANIENNTQLVKYDAFVLFADDDIDFATEVIETMEKQYNLKFCVKDRDLVGGTFEHNAIIKLITERCEKLIVILSPSFFNSPMNKFFLQFTQAISIEQRKIIPCLYKACPDMPPEIRCYFMLDYTKPRYLWNFWDKLYESIKTKKAPPNASNRVALGISGEQPRPLIIKTNSHRETTESRLRPTVAHSVKFNSLVDLTKTEEILPDPNLIPSTSANSLGFSYDSTESQKKIKQKTNWFRKFLQKYDKNYEKNQHINGNSGVAGVVGGGKVDMNDSKEKRRFWNRHRRRKVALTT